MIAGWRLSVQRQLLWACEMGWADGRVLPCLLKFSLANTARNAMTHKQRQYSTYQNRQWRKSFISYLWDFQGPSNWPLCGLGKHPLRSSRAFFRFLLSMRVRNGTSMCRSHMTHLTSLSLIFNPNVHTKLASKWKGPCTPLATHRFWW